MSGVPGQGPDSVRHKYALTALIHDYLLFVGMNQAPYISFPKEGDKKNDDSGA